MQGNGLPILQVWYMHKQTHLLYKYTSIFFYFLNFDKIDLEKYSSYWKQGSVSFIFFLCSAKTLLSIVADIQLINYFMRQNREGRFKTVYFGQVESVDKRIKAGTSNPFKINFKTSCDEVINEVVFKTSSKETMNSPIAFKDSARGNGVQNNNKNPQKSNVDTWKHHARFQLQKLSLKEKLIQIESILKNTRELCKKYGYFSVTFAMLKFNFNQPNKVTVWIHPDQRALKPLHPIKKQTQFQCEIACVTELKTIIKVLFPTVELGDDKTFANMIAHINGAKNQLQAKTRGGKRYSSKAKQFTNNSFQRSKDNFLIVSSKTIPTIGCLKSEEEIADENNRKTFKNNNLKIKQTTSTLVQSIRSANSLRDKLKFELTVPKTPEKSNEEKVIKKQRKPSFSQPKQLAPPQPQQKLQEVKKEVGKKVEEQEKIGKLKQSQLCSSPSTKQMKSSLSGRRILSMSIEIESQINNLFGTQEMRNSNFYSRNSDAKNLKTSLLSKVAEQFQDLF